MVLFKTTMQVSNIAFFAAAIVLLAGCQMSQTVSDLSLKPFKGSSEPEIEFGQPLRMAIIWKESAVTAPGKKPVRGFGGRVYFYDEENETIRVDGELTVYAFDDTNDHAVKARQPDRKYIFRASELQEHYGQTGLGDSYNIWIPWDEVGGPRKTISLVPIFKPEGGMVPKSDQSIAILSGTTPEEETGNSRRRVDPLVKKVSMTSSAADDGQASPLPVTVENGNSEKVSPESTIRTTTFEMSRSTASRLNTSKPSSVQRSFVAADNNNLKANSSKERRTTAATPRKAAETTASGLAGRPQREFPGVPKGSSKEAKLVKPTVFGQPGGFR